MSVPVAIEQLREEVGRFGPAPYLLTVAGDGRPHAVSVTVAWAGEALTTSVGRTTATNAGDRPAVSLLWAPYESGGFSLIVDGTASVATEDENLVLTVAPTKAVLHRSQPGTNAGAYASQCVRIEAP
jgi:hypothetical protein